MRKFFTLFAAALFAGSIFAADAKVTLDFTSGGAAGDNPWGLPIDYNKEEASYTKGGQTITFSASNSGHKAYFTAKKESTDTIWNGFLMGKKNATLSFPAMTFDVSKIVVYWVSTSGSANVEHSIFVGEDAVSDTVTGCKITETADSSVFNIAAAKRAAGTVYSLKVVSDHNMQVSKVEFYETVAGAPELPVFSVPEGYYDAAQTVEISCPTAGAKIYYTLDGTTPTSASTEYSAAIAISKTTTVKAIAIANSISSELAVATYTIISTTGKGTKDDPYTTEDVIKWNNKRGSDERYWVRGFILGGADNDGKIKDPAKVDSASVALGATADQTEGAIPVQLSKKPDAAAAVREALAVKDNPGNIGKEVKVYGHLVGYFNYFGVKEVTDYEWISSEPSHEAAIKSLKVGEATLEATDNKFSYAAPNDASDELPVVFTVSEGATANPASGFKITVPAAGAEAVDSTIVVTAEDGTTKATYHVLVTRKAADAPKSDVATIKSLTINGEAVAEKEGVFAVELPADSKLTEVEVAFVLTDPNAKADKANPFKITVPAAGAAAATEKITVTAEDGTTKKEYTVSVSKAKADDQGQGGEGGEDQAVDNINAANQAVKFIENGQIIILKNGVKYTISGSKTASL